MHLYDVYVIYHIEVDGDSSVKDALSVVDENEVIVDEDIIDDDTDKIDIHILEAINQNDDVHTDQIDDEVPDAIDVMTGIVMK